MNTITVAITEEMKLKARNCSNTILSRLPPRDNYTGLEQKDRYYHGYLGEFAFEEVLKMRNKKAVHNIVLNGASQGEDFLCSFPIGDKKIDIKISAREYSDGMIFPVSQYQQQGYIYVGVKLSDKHAQIMGWCWFYQMNKHPEVQRRFPIPTNYIPYTEMNDITGLINKMIDGPFVTNYLQ